MAGEPELAGLWVDLSEVAIKKLNHHRRLNLQISSPPGFNAEITLGKRLRSAR